MYSSALKPLTSPAILVSKFVVSKWVMRPMPESPSTRFDHTASTSLPIGVMKPMPVTATRRPLELDLAGTSMRIRTWRPTHIVTVWENERRGLDFVSNPGSDQLPQIQSQLEPEAIGGVIEIASQELAKLVQPVEDRVPVKVELGGGLLDRSAREVGLEGFQQLLAVAGPWIEQRAEAVRDKALRKPRILGKNQVRDNLVMPVRDRVGPQLSAGFDRLLGLEVGPGDAPKAGVIAADAGTNPGPCRAGSVDRLLVQLGHELAGAFHGRGGLGGAEGGPPRPGGHVVGPAAREGGRGGKPSPRLAPPGGRTGTAHQPPHPRPLAGGPDGDV